MAPETYGDPAPFSEKEQKLTHKKSYGSKEYPKNTNQRP